MCKRCLIIFGLICFGKLNTHLVDTRIGDGLSHSSDLYENVNSCSQTENTNGFKVLNLSHKFID